MKTIYRLIAVLIMAPVFIASAQQKHDPVFQGNVTEFISKFKGVGRTNVVHKEVQLKVSQGSFVNVVVQNQKKIGDIDSYTGQLKNGNSLVNLRFESKHNRVEGSIVLKDKKEAYKIYSDNTSKVFLQEVDINQVICSDFFKPAAQVQSLNSISVPPGVSVYGLQSYPSATAVIMLDFDGEVVPAGTWSNEDITAEPAPMTNEEIYEAWLLVSEDYRPFNINVTTDESVFQQAPVTKRVRAIVTPTDDVYPGVGGVAFIGTFGSSIDIPCWVFNMGGKVGGETISHEVGHTLDLLHDNYNDGTVYEEYYDGHAANWAPIMGVGFYKDVVQWSKGEYQYALNTEDDLAIISSPNNGFGYRQDLVPDFSYSPYTPTPLNINYSGIIDPALNHGIIETTNDGDVFSFTTTGGNVNITVTPAETHPNLDIRIALRVSTQYIDIIDPQNQLPATLNENLTPGTYTIEIQGVGNANPLTTGYSDYGSLGYYSISGNIPGGNLRVPENPSGTVNGMNFSYYQGSWNALPNFSSLTPASTGTISIFDLSPKTNTTNYGFSYRGYISVPTDGDYTFYTSSDDGSKLYIGNSAVVDNDGLHGVQERSGTIGLKAGKHAIKVEFFQKDGGEKFFVSYSGPGISKRTIPSLALYRVGTANPGEFVGYYKLVSKRSGKVIEVPGGNLNDGVFIDQHSYNGNNYQKWLLESLGEGHYKISCKHSRKSLDVFGNEYSDGAVIKQWEYESFDNQKWSIVNVGSGYYKIVAKHSGKALEVADNSTLNGALILQRTYSGTDNQKWQLVSLGVAGREALPEDEVELSDNETLNVYPNPAQNQLNISHYAKEGGTASVQILNDLSQIQLSQEFNVQKGSNNLELDISKVNQGLHILRVTDGKSIRFKKILIVK
jgi:hypothetical protein